MQHKINVAKKMIGWKSSTSENATTHIEITVDTETLEIREVHFVEGSNYAVNINY